MTFARMAAFREIDGVSVHKGIDPLTLERRMMHHRLVLPPEHQNFLLWSNGMEVYAGYFRLFGLNSAVDLLSWNEPEQWKFAWHNHCSEYYCFGETAWGDQYAYSIESLKKGVDCEVYFLDAFSMSPKVIAASFIEFLGTEFLRSASEPYDRMTRLARRQFGPLDLNSHLVYTPSLLLGGSEAIENVQTMNARAAMICNGDIANQVDGGPPNALVERVEPFEDDRGRMRIKIVWAGA